MVMIDRNRTYHFGSFGITASALPPLIYIVLSLDPCNEIITKVAANEFVVGL